MKALKATAGTSQPVLSCQDIQTVFFQVPELLALHRDFYQSLKARLEGATELGEGLRNEQRQGACRSLSAEQGLGNEQRQGVCRSLSTEQDLVVEQCKDHYKLSVGDLFQKLVSLCCVALYDITISPVICFMTNEPYRKPLCVCLMPLCFKIKLKISYCFLVE